MDGDKPPVVVMTDLLQQPSLSDHYVRGMIDPVVSVPPPPNLLAPAKAPCLPTVQSPRTSSGACGILYRFPLDAIVIEGAVSEAGRVARTALFALSES